MLKKITFSNLEQDLYFERLESGLEVYLVPYEYKNSYYMSYGTKFGSMDTFFVPFSKEKEATMPLGIAHFLEHKLFEQKDGLTPNEFYAKSGSMINAETTYNNTRYFVIGSNDVYKDLDYLLSFVSNPYFTDANVEKEKGIISEEIKMYDDEPEWIFERKLREMIFQKSSYREDIAGTIESINKINKEVLYDCYHTFYTPNNMFIIVTGKFDKDEIMKVIKNNQYLKSLKPIPKVLKQKITEPKDVTDKFSEIELNITVPKVAYVIKIPKDKFSIKDSFTLRIYLSILLSVLFNDSSEFISLAKKNKWIITFSSYTSNIVEDYVTLNFISETNQPNKLLEELKKELVKFKLKEEDFERIKKVWIANEIRSLDLITDTLNILHNEIVKYNRIYPDRIDHIRNLKFSTLNKLIKELDFTVNTTLIAVPKSKN